MRHTFQAHVVAVILSVAAALSADNRLLAAEPAAKPSHPSTKPSVPGPSNKPDLLHAFNPQRPGVLSPQAAATAMEKLRTLGALLGRALDVAVDLLSGNETDLLSRNKTALLSGNSPKLLSGNSPNLLSGNAPNLLSGNAPNLLSGNAPNLLSGNAPKILSENKTPILSGNTISMFSNIKVEIHIYNNNNGNNNTVTGNTAQPPRIPAGPNSGPSVNPPPRR
ncbi:MAG: hypothetical protein ACLP9L_38095 [Thermoguttaceae bacterium]